MNLNEIYLSQVIELEKYVGLFRKIKFYLKKDDLTLQEVLNLDENFVKNLQGSGAKTIKYFKLSKEIILKGNITLKQIAFSNKKLKDLIINKFENQILFKDLRLFIRPRDLKIINKLSKYFEKTLTISDYLSINEDELKYLTGFGKKSKERYDEILANLEDYISEYLKKFKNIEVNTPFHLVEEVLLKDISNFINSLDERQNLIITNRLGYKTKILTLEAISKNFDLTRERVRQLETLALENLIMFKSLDINQLKDYLVFHQKKGFHKIFPKLDEVFVDADDNTKANNRSKSVIEDCLIFFLEKYCLVNKDFFQTPDIEAYNLLENKDKIIAAIPDINFPLSIPEFAEEISDLYGYDKELSINIIPHLIKSEILALDENDQIYPYKISISKEMLMLLNQHRDGIHFKELNKIVNTSPSKNKIQNKASQRNLLHYFNEDLILIGRGKYKLLKYSNTDLIDDAIFEEIEKHLIKNNNISYLEQLFDDIRSFLPEDVDKYDLRAFIKLNGEHHGVYFDGKSQSRTVSLGKKIRHNREQQIERLANTFTNEISLEDINKQINGNLNLTSSYLIRLNNKALICRTTEKHYLSNNSAYQNLNLEKYIDPILSIIDLNEITSFDYLSSELNRVFMQNKSKYFHNSLVKYLIRKKNIRIFHNNELFSKIPLKYKNLSSIFRERLNLDLPYDDNFELVKKDTNCLKRTFIIYYNNKKYYS